MHIDSLPHRERSAPAANNGFVDREALLDRLDEFLTAGGTYRWVVVNGGREGQAPRARCSRRGFCGASEPARWCRITSPGQYDWGDPAS
jgi:hypothetical protein